MSKPRSLSLAAYRVLSWGVPQSSGHSDTARPEGEVLWVHVSAPDRLRAVDDCCHRLLSVRPGLSLLLTAPPEADLSEWGDCGTPILKLPAEHTGSARAFLDHWRPDMGLWFGGGLMPNIITRAQERDILLILLEAAVDVNTARGGRWLPDITRYTLDCFKAIIAPDNETARQIRRLGVNSAKISVTPPLHISPNPSPWPEDELIETNHTLAGRPVWLAAWVQDKEFISVLSAHRQALRMLPRLALILHVADMSEAAPLYKRLEAMDLRCANWDDGHPIEDTTQVILSAGAEDLGLWHRVSAVTFMGSSLERDAGGHDPLTAVALGSAVIHGPHVSKYRSLYDRLDQAKAALTIKSATELGDGVVELLAPDRTADMALAGWQIVTEGAPQADQLIEMVQDTLDQRRAQDART
ncbi:3-deoxy-D-manno-octulosonic-acid transferase [Ruegeria halocynthiae]|uniref:3-deoxy-D-manno-octulosonic acid transferase n=1 Tax=Ruegeria halocynthiae TaxID=985054 RepID=A0A1H3BZC1_9RHOB|nr:glycosyltransferase N-terminal domain-containing protein [Ruegeria halocynthiae]SDX47151.1 3-deoxy-D-manno-octulosonic-acid transferase [Ruegeria halocynthiae]